MTLTGSGNSNKGQHASTGRLDAAAVEGGASRLAVGPSDAPGQQMPLLGVDGVGGPDPDGDASMDDASGQEDDNEAKPTTAGSSRAPSYIKAAMTPSTFHYT